MSVLRICCHCAAQSHIHLPAESHCFHSGEPLTIMQHHLRACITMLRESDLVWIPVPRSIFLKMPEYLNSYRLLGSCLSRSRWCNPLVLCTGMSSPQTSCTIVTTEVVY